MKCPKCGSEHIQYATTTSGGGTSFLDSCCGFIILGPIGLLCGNIGSSVTTEEFWICQECGNKFSNEKAKAYMEREQERQQNLQNSEEQARRDAYTKYRKNSQLLKQKNISMDDELKYRKVKRKLQEYKLEAQKKYDDALLELSQTPNPAFSKPAKELVDLQHGKRKRNISTNIFTAIFAISFVVWILADVGLLASLVSFVAAIICQSLNSRSVQQRKEHLRQKLVAISPRFSKAIQNIADIDNKLSHISNIVDAIQYVEKYETEHKIKHDEPLSLSDESWL